MPRKSWRPTTAERQLGRRLGEMRRTLKPGVPLGILAREAGITDAQWRNLEAARSGFTIARLTKCCEALGCDMHDLLDDEPKKNSGIKPD